MLEQGIDTTTPLGRLFFRILAALAEFDREMIVEGTLEGLASSARARDRVGGRPPKMTQVKLDLGQQILDEGKLTAAEIARAPGVGRSTLYENLPAYKNGGNCVLVVYCPVRLKLTAVVVLSCGSPSEFGRLDRRSSNLKWRIPCERPC